MLDKIDKKILLALAQNSRQAISTLAKKLRVSRDIVNYRINRLVRLNIVRDFTTDIDIKKLGFLSALFFISIKAEAEKDFINYISTLYYVSWAGTHMGFWSLGFSIYGKDHEEIQTRIEALLKKFNPAIINHRFEFYNKTKFFTEKYFGKPKRPPFKKPIKHIIDNKDKLILKYLSKNARMTTVELSKHISLSSVAIANRIKKLEESQIIQGYSVYINVFKLNTHLFIFFIKNKNINNKRKLYTFLEQHPNVSMLLDYVGSQLIEFSLFSNNPYNIREFLQEIKETFPENELVDFFMTQEDFISYGAPSCVFD